MSPYILRKSAHPAQKVFPVGHIFELFHSLAEAQIQEKVYGNKGMHW